MSNEQNNISLGSGWVLLVEDDPEVAILLGEGLKEAGYRVIFAYNVHEAIVKVERQNFKMVLLDLHLANGNGEAVIEAMRKKDALNFRTPILIMSAYVSAPVVRRIRTQVQGVLVKPFGIQTLLTRVKAAMEADPTASENGHEQLRQGEREDKDTEQNHRQENELWK